MDAGMSLQYNATLVERVDVTDALSIFHVQPDKPPRNRPWFTPGQYCVLGLNDAGPGARPVRRSMSIASSPESDGPIEFYIRYVAHPESPSPFTHLLWRLGKGDRLHIRTVAAGVFTIQDTIGRDDSRIRVMVAAGTGLAPFLSMVRSEVYRNPRVDLSRWALLHGASYPAELGYRRQLLQLSAVNHLKYWGTVSRPSEAVGWTGDMGRVDAYFTPDRLPDLEKRLGLSPGGFTPRNVVTYICGLTGTIKSTMTSLIDRGFVPAAMRVREALGVPPEERASLFYEDYETEPVIDINDSPLVESLRARMQTALAKR